MALISVQVTVSTTILNSISPLRNFCIFKLFNIHGFSKALWNQWLGYFFSPLEKPCWDFSASCCSSRKCQRPPWGPDCDTGKASIQRPWRQVGGTQRQRILVIYGEDGAEWGCGKGNKGPQQSPLYPWTPASNTHRQSRGKRNQYWLMLCSGSIRYIWPWRRNMKGKASEQMKKWGVEESNEAHFEGQHCSLLLLDCSLASRSCTVLFSLPVTFFCMILFYSFPKQLIYCRGSTVWLIYFNLVLILLSIMHASGECHKLHHTKLERLN